MAVTVIGVTRGVAALLLLASLQGSALAQPTLEEEARAGLGSWAAPDYTLGVSTGLRWRWADTMYAATSADTRTEPTASADAPRRTGGGGLAARQLANQVNDPTAPLTLIQFRDIIVPHVTGADSPGNVLQLQPLIPIPKSRFVPLEQLIKITFPIVTTPSPDSVTGSGDLQIFDLITIKESWGKWGFGPTLVFPTASSTILGQGKWQAGPSVAAIYTGTKNLVVGAVLQNPISFAGDSSRPSVNNLIVTPTLTYNLSDGWFAGYSDFDWNFDWENRGAATIPVGLQVGKIFKIGQQAFSLSFEGAYTAARPSNTATPKWLVGIEFTVILSGH